MRERRKKKELSSRNTVPRCGGSNAFGTCPWPSCHGDAGGNCGGVGVRRQGPLSQFELRPLPALTARRGGRSTEISEFEIVERERERDSTLTAMVLMNGCFKASAADTRSLPSYCRNFMSNSNPWASIRGIWRHSGSGLYCLQAYG